MKAMLFAIPTALTLSVGVQAEEISESGCGVIYEDKGQVRTSIVDGFSVLAMTREQEHFVLSALPVKADRIYCLRSDIVPAEHDDKVVLGSFPIYIASGGRLAKLDIAGGEFVFAQLSGSAIEEAVQMRVMARLRAFNSTRAGSGAGPQ